jgi:hypothetical protein
LAEGVFGQEAGGLLLGLHQVDLYQLDALAKKSNQQLHAVGVTGQGVAVEFHLMLLSSCGVESVHHHVGNENHRQRQETIPISGIMFWRS